LDEFEAEMKASETRQQSISGEELENAIAVTGDYLRTGWDSGGRRLRQFVWSFWNGSHLINPYDLSCGLDARLTDAVIVLFGAAMADVLTEDQKRRILTELALVSDR
jgi:hypothetical protein